jgi:leucyl/phenylalanyl-tRNA--protein transferase
MLPNPADAEPGEDLVGIGADLEPGTLLAAYRAGLFPMRVGDERVLGWWSPDPRGVIPLDGFVAHRSLRKAARRFEVRIDTAFTEVMRACGDPARPHGWIDDEFIDAYTALYDLGWAHSIETWSLDGELVGGVYGVAIGGLFAGESMFHRVRDASKVALWACVEHLNAIGVTVFDVQWTTPHLVSLGAVDVPRPVYLERLHAALERRVEWSRA